MREPDYTKALHPGKILKEKYMEPRGMSGRMLAKELGFSATSTNDLIQERHGVTANTAIKLSRVLNTTAEYWMNLQVLYDLKQAYLEEEKDKSSI